MRGWNNLGFFGGLSGHSVQVGRLGHVRKNDFLLLGDLFEFLDKLPIGLLCMRAEQEEAELKAAYEQRKAEERARAAVPATTEVKDAWKSLGVEAPEPATFETKGEDANADLRPLDQTDLGEEVASDEDVLNAAELVQVRQDKGVQPDAQEPDWELIEKLEEIAEKDEIVLPDVPEAPDLDAVAAQSSEDSEAVPAPL